MRAASSGQPETREQGKRGEHRQHRDPDRWERPRLAHRRSDDDSAEGCAGGLRREGTADPGGWIRHDQRLALVRTVATFDRRRAHDRERGANGDHVGPGLDEIVARCNVGRDRHVLLEVALLEIFEGCDRPTGPVGLRNQDDLDGASHAKVTANLDDATWCDSLGSELKDELAVGCDGNRARKPDGGRHHDRRKKGTGRPEGGPNMRSGHEAAYGEPTGQAGAVVVSESVQWIRPWIAGLIRPPGWATM